MAGEKQRLIIRGPRLAFSIAVAVGSLLLGILTSATLRKQDPIPSVPVDRSQIYVANATNTLEQLPVEVGTTPIQTDRVAGSDKSSYIELKGSSSEKAIEDPLPRIFLFVADEANVHPPFIVRLTQKKSARRVTAMAQKGQKGFAVDSEEIVKPHYRVLSRVDGTLFMEIRPRESLAPGEYAIIGSELKRIATFRVVTTSTR